jgi:hypothetical protein
LQTLTRAVSPITHSKMAHFILCKFYLDYYYQGFLKTQTYVIFFNFYFFWQDWSLNSGLHHFSHTSSPFGSVYFRDEVLRTICLGWPQTMILQISASHVARNTSVFLDFPSRFPWPQCGFWVCPLLDLKTQVSCMTCCPTPHPSTHKTVGSSSLSTFSFLKNDAE